MRTRVCITIDTEFSIAGAFSRNDREPVAEPLVWCKVNGRSEGLGFMLDTFSKYNIQATFFVETVHRYYFKHDPMKPIAQQIHAAGHDVQLHTHPCWSFFQYPDWREQVRGKPGRDDFAGRDIDDSVRLIQQGIDSFADWGLPRPLVFRSGNLQHDDNLYKALARTGIPYSSNVAVGIFDSGQEQYKLFSGQHDRHGVREFPVLSYSDWRAGTKQNVRSLTIAGASFAETRSILEKCRAAGIAQVVILTHPFEYVQNSDVTYRKMRRHSLTQKRLRQLCRYLHDNADRFEACGLAQAAAANPRASTDNILLNGHLWHTVPRMAAQVAYHKIGHFLLARTPAPQEAA